MGRKTKGGAAKRGAPSATIDKINSYEDTLEEGGVDDFMFKRDQISFNPQNDSDDDDINADQGEEILSLEKPRRRRDALEDEAEEAYGEDDFDDEEESFGAKQRKQKTKPDHSTKGRFGKEEADSDDSMDDEDESASGSEDEDEEGWGRQYYSRPSTRREKEKEGVYDAQREEEREMEEKEVRRLQRRAREAMEGEDWGLDDIEVEHVTAAAPAKDDDAEAAPEVIPEAPKTDDPTTLLRYLQRYEPLKLALARDFSLVVRKLKKTARGIKKMEAEFVGEESLHKGLGWLHYQTLLTYATTLAFYIHLCSLPVDQRPDMSTHPIMQRLLQLKEGVAALEDLDFAAGSVSDAGPVLFQRPDDYLQYMEDDDGVPWDDGGDDDNDLEEKAELIRAKRELLARTNEGAGMLPEDDDISDDYEDMDLEADATNLWHTAGMDDSELDDLLADAKGGKGASAAAPATKKVQGKKEKRSRKKTSKTEDDEAEPTVSFTPMVEDEFVSSSSKKKRSKAPAFADEEETLGDATSLDDADASDKEKRTRSLRFHTSKIAATSARRDAARKKRLGGDDDIPYRDRQAARDAALRKNAPKGASAGEDLDGSDWTESDRKRAREVRDEADEDAAAADDGDDGYYDLVKRRKVARDDAKVMAHEAFREEKFASFEDESSEGPRALTRAIEKNRGLTPKRSKTGRNPRVKKKLAYEKAKQKVGSQRAVYKGGQGALSGSYSGEKTGISMVSKSRKF